MYKIWAVNGGEGESGMVPGVKREYRRVRFVGMSGKRNVFLWVAIVAVIDKTIWLYWHAIDRTWTRC